MAIVFPGEVAAPIKPDLESIESFDNSQIGGVEKFSSVNANVIDVSEVVSKGGDTMTGRLITTSGGIRITGGTLDVERVAVADSYSTVEEVIVAVTDTSSARTITLTTALLQSGRIIIVKDESGGANTNNITVDTQGSELIDGAASSTISTNYGSVRLYSNGTHWFSF